jgi:MFS family permease
MSGIITEPIFLGSFPKIASDYKLGSIQALVVAIYEIGCLLGSFMIIGFGDKLGRRHAYRNGHPDILYHTCAAHCGSVGTAYWS